MTHGVKVSLLPDYLKKQRSRLKLWTMIALILVVFAMIILTANILFSFYMQTPMKELEEVKSHSEKLTREIANFSEVQRMKETNEITVEKVDKLKGDPTNWAYIFNMSTLYAELYSIDISEIEVDALKGKQCKINGKAENLKELTNWTKILEKQEEISVIELGNVSTLNLDNGLVFTFEAIIYLEEQN